MNPNTTSIAKRIAAELSQTTSAPAVDGNEVRLGTRRVAFAVKDGTLIWEGQEQEDGDWWPAAGPHRLPVTAPMGMYDTIASMDRLIGYQVTWTSLTEHIAYGRYEDGNGHQFRVAVAYVDALTPLSALALADWVAGNIA